MHFDSNLTKKTLKTKSGSVTYFSLKKLEDHGFGKIDRLPFSIKILLESALRNNNGYTVTEKDIQNISNWKPDTKGIEIPFNPARVVLQDFTGVPCLVDLAAMRDALKKMGSDPMKVNPLVPCDLVIDHSIQVDAFGSKEALKKNLKIEFERNRERYEFLKWGQKAFQNFRVVPPGTGIVHQVNLEYLAKGVLTEKCNESYVAYPDSVVGTDSHTTMINGLGVVGWGVGGIEAEAVMLGEPIYMVMPQVVGVKFTGRLKEGVTATDLVLTITELLRKTGVVGKFVEYFGTGMHNLNLPDRATLANMAPEYGATMGYFPVDSETLAYYRLTGRDEETIDLVEHYTKAQGLFYEKGMKDPTYSKVLELDLSHVEPSLAGPKRPQDRVSLKEVGTAFHKSLTSMVKHLPTSKAGTTEVDWAANGGAVGSNAALDPNSARRGITMKLDGDGECTLHHGSVVVAAITSCTNTSNPSVMIAAGLLAKKAVERGLKTKPWVKTSLAPGSLVVTEYLNRSGLTQHLEKLGFFTVGYGCTTCIGNSGPLMDSVSHAIKEGDLVVASVLSGNRNFEGRIHPLCKANYLTSPPLVVAFALAGKVDIDLSRESLGTNFDGKEIYLKDIWPTGDEVKEVMSKSVSRKMFQERYKDVFEGTDLWQKIPVKGKALYEWNENSTYIQEPPFFSDLPRLPQPIQPIKGARVLVSLGDSVTTDHISPAGSIPEEGPAGKFLKSLGVERKDFNSFGSRRGNDRVMTRGTFGNIRIKNLLVPGTEGGVTVHFPTNQRMSIFEAAEKYKVSQTPLIVLAGKEYGAGSSRDWAAKGTNLLGVAAVIAESYERIHRSNLLGMGVVPLQFKEGQTRDSLGLKGDEVFDIPELFDTIQPAQEIKVIVTSKDGQKKEFKTLLRLDTKVEIDYYRNGGILPYVLRKLAKN